MPRGRHLGAPKHGGALLAGLVRCRRCGRKLTVHYTGAKHNIPRYSCWRGPLDNGEPRCIAFGGLRVDDAIEEALLRVVGPGAIAAAVEAEAQAASRRDQVRDALVRDLEAARYSADQARPRVSKLADLMDDAEATEKSGGSRTATALDFDFDRNADRCFDRSIEINFHGCP